MTELVSRSLENRVALVTGASRGIGRAIALELARGGAAVVVNYKNSPEAAEAVVSEIQAAGGRASSFQADVSDFQQAQDLVKFAVDTFGNLDILVNNAGITRDMLIMMMPEDDWDAVIHTNLKSTFNCSKAAVKHMMRKRYGRVINIASVAGILGNPGQTNYSASKAGQIGFTRALAREVASRNITVNAVAPGFIISPMTDPLPEKVRQALIDRIPLGRMGTDREVAAGICFLASDEASYITGHVLDINGGLYLA